MKSLLTLQTDEITNTPNDTDLGANFRKVVFLLFQECNRTPNDQELGALIRKVSNDQELAMIKK